MLGEGDDPDPVISCDTLIGLSQINMSVCECVCVSEREREGKACMMACKVMRGSARVRAHFTLYTLSLQRH